MAADSAGNGHMASVCSVIKSPPVGVHAAIPSPSNAAPVRRGRLLCRPRRTGAALDGDGIAACTPTGGDLITEHTLAMCPLPAESAAMAPKFHVAARRLQSQ